LITADILALVSNYEFDLSCGVVKQSVSVTGEFWQNLMIQNCKAIGISPVVGEVDSVAKSNL